MRTSIALAAVSGTLSALLFAHTSASGDTDVSVTPNDLVRLESIRVTSPSDASGTSSSRSEESISESGFTPSDYYVTDCINYSDGRIECPEQEADSSPASAEQLTPGRIEQAIREIEMPRLALRVQPGDRTLVNVPTILSTTPADVDRTITLLGVTIDVQASPTSYTWHHGDGTSQTTSGPGAPWPAKDVTHTYRRSAAQVSLRLDVAYTVRYRVDGGTWTPLAEPLTTTSAPVSLRVDQAAPVLTRP